MELEAAAAAEIVRDKMAHDTCMMIHVVVGYRLHLRDAAAASHVDLMGRLEGFIPYTARASSCLMQGCHGELKALQRAWGKQTESALYRELNLM